MPVKKVAKKKVAKKKAVARKGPGRPHGYRDEYAEQARKLCLLGYTGTQLADFFEVAESTIYKWQNEVPDFKHKIRLGKDIADANVADSLYQRANGYSHPDTHIAVVKGEVVKIPTTKHYPPDTGAAMAWLKNRNPDKWRDRYEVRDPDNPLMALAKSLQGGALLPGRQQALPGNNQSIIPGTAQEIENDDE